MCDFVRLPEAVVLELLGFLRGSELAPLRQLNGAWRAQLDGDERLRRGARAREFARFAADAGALCAAPPPHGSARAQYAQSARELSLRRVRWARAQVRASVPRHRGVRESPGAREGTAVATLGGGDMELTRSASGPKRICDAALSPSRSTGPSTLSASRTIL